MTENERVFRTLSGRIAELERQRNEALARGCILAGELAVVLDDVRRVSAETAALATKVAGLEKTLRDVPEPPPPGYPSIEPEKP